jgi:hypothetical protein
MALGLSYTEVLKIYLKAKIRGQEMSSSDLTKMIVDLYKDYVSNPGQAPKNEESPPPRTIDIQ